MKTLSPRKQGSSTLKIWAAVRGFVNYLTKYATPLEKITVNREPLNP
ncbi:MAG: hypothetical protein HY360_10395 [Verrucomicrobia bacterium]|nr:hypothetical protein [Verrucomicrobiota bacterium]